MHPLSIFPQLFFLELLSPLILRLTVGLYLIYLGKERQNNIYNYLSIIYILCGILFIFGFYTQVAVIIGLILISFDFYIENKQQKIERDRKIVYIMSFIIIVSLLFTGAGAFALDMPL